MAYRKLVLLLLALFISRPAMALNVGGCGTGSVLVGGSCLSTTGLIILKAHIYSGAVSSFYNASYGTTRGVYAPSGVSFVLRAARIERTVASAVIGGGMELLYCDTDPGQEQASTACANQKGVFTGVSSGNTADMLFTAAWSATPISEVSVGGHVPSGKYAFIKAISGQTYGTVTLYGYEQ